MDRSLLLVSAETLARLIEDIRRPPGGHSGVSMGTDVRSAPQELDLTQEPTVEPKPQPAARLATEASSAASPSAGVYSSQPTRARGSRAVNEPSKFSPKASRLTDIGRREEKAQTVSLQQPQQPQQPIAERPVVPRTRSDNSEPLLAPLAEVSDRIERLQHTFQRADGINSRIALGLRWIVGGSGALAAFIADADGLALANHQAPEAYIAVSPDLASVQDTLNAILPRPVEGALVVAVDEHNLLQLLFTTTAIGRLAVGLVVTEPLPAPEVNGIRNIVRAATQPTEPHARTA